MTTARPLLHNATIVCFGSIDWSFNWQIPQEVSSELARAGHRVLYIENTGVRRAMLKDAARVGARLRNWWQANGQVRSVGPRLDVFAPVLLPFPYSRLACRINTQMLGRVCRRWIGDKPRSPVIFLTFLPTPLARSVARRLGPSLVVYYCADRLAESSPGARKLVDPELALLSEADVVFTSSAGLLGTAAPYNPRAVLLTSGVQSRNFDRARKEAVPLPALHGLRRPIVGFVGSLRNEIDIPLLARVARLAPDLTFVLVGPVVADVSELAACPNVHLIGAVSHAEAVRFMLAFDLGVLPYVINGYTTDLKPVKMTEYLAAGLPIVGTNLPEVRRFVSEHGPVVQIADGADAFADAVRTALTNNSAGAMAERIAIARRYDWTHQMSRMTGVLESALEDRLPAPLMQSAS